MNIIFKFVFTILLLNATHLQCELSSCRPSQKIIVETFENEQQVRTLILDLQLGIQLAMTISRRLGSAFSGAEQAEIAIASAESEFDIRIFPKGDAGYIGGGKAGEGLTVGTGVELYKKFVTGTRFSFNPSAMMARKNFQSNLRTSIKQPLMRGFGTEYNLAPIRAAQYSQRSAYRSLYLSQIRLIIQTIQGLYDIARQEALAELDRESMERIKKFCTSTRVKEKVGLCEAMDVYRADIELKHAEDALNQSLDRLQEAKDAIRDLLSLPWDLELEVRLPIDYEDFDVPFEEAIAVALFHRVEIDQARDQVDEAKRLIRVAAHNLMPELNVDIDYTSFAYDEIFTRSWTTKRESRWGFGLTSSSDVFKVNENAAFDQSLINKNDAERNEAQVRENVILEVKRSIRSLNRTKEKIALQEEQVHNSQKEFQLARLKFQHGLANNFDLIQAEKNLRSAQMALISATIEHKIGGFKLLASIGTLTDKPGMCQ